MGNAVAIAFFTVLALLTLVAGRTWYQRRAGAADQAHDRVFRRFVLGLIAFWILAVIWVFWGPGSLHERVKVIGSASDGEPAVIIHR